jgi:hypothetical protein
MDRSHRRRKCLCCKEFFLPDYRNRRRQTYCSKEPCRVASKAASQRSWLSKPANRSYFSGKANTIRVQQWRKANPGYGKRRKKNAAPATAQSESAQPVAAKSLALSSDLVTQPPLALPALQDVCLAQNPLFIGLISMFSGSALQEDIDSFASKLEARGRDILKPPQRVSL